MLQVHFSLGLCLNTSWTKYLIWDLCCIPGDIKWVLLQRNGVDLSPDLCRHPVAWMIVSTEPTAPRTPERGTIFVAGRQLGSRNLGTSRCCPPQVLQNHQNLVPIMMQLVGEGHGISRWTQIISSDRYQLNCIWDGNVLWTALTEKKPDDFDSEIQQEHHYIQH